MAGMLVGSFLIGLISDKSGRMNAHMVAMLAYIVGGCTSASLPADPSAFPYFVLSRFLSAIGQVGLCISCCTLAVEYTGRNKRMFCGMFHGVPFAAGGLIVGLVAWAGIRDWRTLQYSCTLPWLGLLSWYFIFPESPRWLLAKGKFLKC